MKDVMQWIGMVVLGVGLLYLVIRVRLTSEDRKEGSFRLLSRDAWRRKKEIARLKKESKKLKENYKKLE